MRQIPAILVSLLRSALAAFLVWTCVQALPASDARSALAALPAYDYWMQADHLRGQQRFSEALLVTDAGLGVETDPFTVARLQETRARIAAERDDWLRRLDQVGQGALTGTGASTEALAGAVAADLFVFGDVRDLVIQGGKVLRGEDTDEVLVALSAAGIVLTVAPTLEFGDALLRFARRSGAMTERFARQLLRVTRGAIEQGDAAPLTDIAADVATLGRSAEPAAAIAVLRHVDDPQALKAAAKVSARSGGSFALWVGERPALELAQDGAQGEALLLRASTKGRAGIEFAAQNARLLTLAHPLLGVIKGIYKYNIPRLLSDLLMQQAPAVLGLLAGWLGFELWLLAHRLGLALTPRRQTQVKQVPEMQRENKPGRREPTVG